MRAWPILGEYTSEGRLCPQNGEVCMAVILISQPRTYIWRSFLCTVFKTGPCPKGKACSPDGNSEVTGLQLQTKQPNVFTKSTLIYLFLQGFD